MIPSKSLIVLPCPFLFATLPANPAIGARVGVGSAVPPTSGVAESIGGPRGSRITVDGLAGLALLPGVVSLSEGPKIRSLAAW